MFAAAAALALFVQTGSADLDCVLGRFTAADRARIAEETVRTGGNGPASERVAEAAADCAERRGWTAEEAGAISGAAFAALVGEQASEELGRAGIDPELIDGWFEGLPAAQRSQVLEREELVTRLFERLQQSGASAARIEANAEQIGLYLGALAAIDAIGRGVSP